MRQPKWVKCTKRRNKTPPRKHAPHFESTVQWHFQKNLELPKIHYSLKVKGLHLLLGKRFKDLLPQKHPKTVKTQKLNYSKKDETFHFFHANHGF
jgi:hypothetical protein